MRIEEDLTRLRRVRRPVVLAAGFFDGLHRGHRKVIDAARRRADALGGQVWVLTFDRHPLRLLAPDRAPPLLTSPRHRLILLRDLGVHGALVLPFTRELAALDAGSFARRLAEGIPSLHDAFVGRNWRFARGGSGTAAELSRLGRSLGFDVTIVPPATRRGETISSTRIRAVLAEGDLAEVERLLGRPFSVLGTVTRGRAVGRTLGYPTANLDYHNEALPPCGVYAARAVLYGPDADLYTRLRGRRRRPGDVHGAVLNLGLRPTFDDAPADRPVMEVHIPDLDRSLYGEDIEVAFAAHLRAEQRFASRRALRDQIERDVAAARRALRESGTPQKEGFTFDPAA